MEDLEIQNILNASIEKKYLAKFIGGDGRSGTTLVLAAIGACDRVLAIPEIHFHLPEDLGEPLLDMLLLFKSEPEKYRSTFYVEEGWERLLFQFVVRCDRAGLSIDELYYLVKYSCENVASTISEYSVRLVLVNIICDYLAEKNSKDSWVLKVMKQIKNAELFFDRWPNAKFLHVIRDGRDVACSQIEGFSWGYSDYEIAAHSWSDLMESIDRLSEKYPIHNVRYEDVVNKPRKTLKEIFSFIEEKWSSSIVCEDEEGKISFPGATTLFPNSVSHASKGRISEQVDSSSIGRYKNYMNFHQYNQFHEIAGERLTSLGYESFPIRKIHTDIEHSGCIADADCAARVERFERSLIPRYISRGWPTEKQVKTALLDLKFSSYEDYIQSIKKIYKGNRIREGKKATKAGYFSALFDRRLHIPDIVEINHSKEVRSGGAMKESYMKGVEDMGGNPKQMYKFESPRCKTHYDLWWGAFENIEGYSQGSIVTNKKLVAYINFRRTSDLAMYNLIIGHGDYLNQGVVAMLHFDIMKWFFSEGNEYVDGLYQLGYAGYFQGGEGLIRWKKSVGFSPVYLSCD